MAETRRIKLGTLLDVAFEIPQIGVVNVRLLFEILRALIAKLGLQNLEIDVELAQSKSLLADKASKSALGDGESFDIEAYYAGLSPEQFAREVHQVLNLLKAYLVRVQSLEVGLTDLRAKRAEDLETMARMMNQIDAIEGRLCEQERKLAKLEGDLECLALTMLDYDIKFEEIARQLDLLDVEIRGVKCEIRCIEKDRKQFVTGLQTVTEQINYFSATKVDKDLMERELALRALADDLQKYVEFDYYNVTQREFGHCIVQLQEEIFRQEQLLKSKAYELQCELKRKADEGMIENIKRQQAKILSKLKLLEPDFNSRTNTSSIAAGVASRQRGSSAHCLSCGVDASLEGDFAPIPKAASFVTPSKLKAIFTLKRRVGGEFTTTKPEEKLLFPRPILGIDCVDTSGSKRIKQVAGGDGCLYFADPEVEI